MGGCSRIKGCWADCFVDCGEVGVGSLIHEIVAYLWRQQCMVSLHADAAESGLMWLWPALHPMCRIICCLCRLLIAPGISLVQAVHWY